QASRRAIGDALSAKAVPVPFRLEGDGKILVRVRFASHDGAADRADLSLVLDTGATKSVLFEDAVASRLDDLSQRKRLRGLSAPTLYGSTDAYITRAPEISVAGAAGTASARDVDLAVIRGELGPALAQSVGAPVDGL